jgi:hypothetical protein
MTTVTSVGYGDHYPVTAAGRGVAFVLMLIGIGIVGLVAASFVSYFVGRRADEVVEPKLAEVLQRLERIEAALTHRDEPERLTAADGADALVRGLSSEVVNRPTLDEAPAAIADYADNMTAGKVLLRPNTG